MYRKISQKLVQAYPCDWDKNLRMKETCICSVEIACSTIMNLFIITLLACFLSKKVEVAVFFIVYGIMRLYAGGTHAASHLKCILFYVMILLISIYAAEYLAKYPNGMYLLGFLVPLISLTVNHLYGGKQKTLEEAESRKYIKYCMAITIFFNISLLIMCFFQTLHLKGKNSDISIYFYIQSFAMLFQSFSLFLGRKQCTRNDDDKVKGGTILL